MCSPEYGLYNPFFLKVLLLSSPHSVLQLSPRENEVFYDVVAIVDPPTREAQKISALLIVGFVLLSFFNICLCQGSYEINNVCLSGL